jgi:hypothetical protein
MSCGAPLDTALLADYWLGLLGEDEEEQFEEHLFECEECSGRLAVVQELAESVRALAHAGYLLMVVSESFLSRAAGKSLHIREYESPAGGSVQCTVTAEDDLLVGRLAADLSAAQRVDLSIGDLEGKELARLLDIPFDTGSTSVLWQQPITYAKAAPSGSMVVRLLDVHESGEERLLGEYTFHHTRTLPGPGAW